MKKLLLFALLCISLVKSETPELTEKAVFLKKVQKRMIERRGTKAVTVSAEDLTNLIKNCTKNYNTTATTIHKHFLSLNFPPSFNENPFFQQQFNCDDYFDAIESVIQYPDPVYFGLRVFSDPEIDIEKLPPYVKDILIPLTLKKLEHRSEQIEDEIDYLGDEKNRSKTKQGFAVDMRSKYTPGIYPSSR